MGNLYILDRGEETDDNKENPCLRNCAGCREPVASFLAQEVAKARQFLAFWSGGTIREDGAAPQSYREIKRMDRRGFFGALFSTGVETAQNVLWPEKGAQPLEKAKWRSRTLRDRQEIGVLPEQTVLWKFWNMAEMVRKMY